MGICRAAGGTVPGRAHIQRVVRFWDKEIVAWGDRVTSQRQHGQSSEKPALLSSATAWLVQSSPRPRAHGGSFRVHWAQREGTEGTSEKSRKGELGRKLPPRRQGSFPSALLFDMSWNRDRTVRGTSSQCLPPSKSQSFCVTASPHHGNKQCHKQGVTLPSGMTLSATSARRGPSAQGGSSRHRPGQLGMEGVTPSLLARRAEGMGTDEGKRPDRQSLHLWASWGERQG